MLAADVQRQLTDGACARELTGYLTTSTSTKVWSTLIHNYTEEVREKSGEFAGFQMSLRKRRRDAENWIYAKKLYMFLVRIWINFTALGSESWKFDILAEVWNFEKRRWKLNFCQELHTFLAK